MPKTIRLNVTHYSILKIPKKRKIQHIPPNHWSDIDSKDLIKLYKDYTKGPVFIFSERYDFIIRLSLVKV